MQNLAKKKDLATKSYLRTRIVLTLNLKVFTSVKHALNVTLEQGIVPQITPLKQQSYVTQMTTATFLMLVDHLHK